MGESSTCSDGTATLKGERFPRQRRRPTCSDGAATLKGERFPRQDLRPPSSNGSGTLKGERFPQQGVPVVLEGERFPSAGERSQSGARTSAAAHPLHHSFTPRLYSLARHEAPQSYCEAQVWPFSITARRRSRPSSTSPKGGITPKWATALPSNGQTAR